MIPSQGDTVMNVLIVEDDADDAFLLERAIRRAARAGGYAVSIAVHRNGWEALKAVARRDITDDLPDFVVVDLNMPVMDGMRFLDRLRGEFRLPALPAYVLTTSDRPEIHERARDMGANRVFVKPDTPDDYTAIVDEMRRLAYAKRSGNRLEAAG